MEDYSCGGSMKDSRMKDCSDLGRGTARTLGEGLLHGGLSRPNKRYISLRYYAYGHPSSHSIPTNIIPPHQTTPSSCSTYSPKLYRESSNAEHRTSNTTQLLPSPIQTPHTHNAVRHSPPLPPTSPYPTNPPHPPIDTSTNLPA